MRQSSQLQNMQMAASPHSITPRGGCQCVGSRTLWMKALTMKVSIMIRRSGSLPWPAQKQCCASHAVLMKALAMIMSMRRSGSHMGRVQFWKCCATMALRVRGFLAVSASTTHLQA